MNWEAVGAVGEIIGAAVVFLTLVYLGVQLKQNTLALRSNRLENWVASASSINDFRAAHAEVLAKAFSAQSLTAAEEIIVNAFSQKLFLAMEAAFLHYQDNTITEEVYNSRIVGLLAALSNPVILAEWEASKGYGFNAGFIRMVDARVSKGGA